MCAEPPAIIPNDVIAAKLPRDIGRQQVYRLLAWRTALSIFFRLLDAL
jgi:hypothetical protein